MSPFKRRLIWLATFLAGLFYLLDFLLPPTIGGAPDSGGAISATPLRLPATADRTAQDLLCYTGTAEGRAPRLLARPVSVADPTAGLRASDEPSTLLAASFMRRDDYFGLQCPQSVAPDRLYYIGLGWDGKTPRVCLAQLEEGEWAPRSRAVIDRGNPGDWDASGITWVSVVPPGGSGGKWLAWYVGKQGDRGRIGFATSPDGVTWTKSARPVYDAGEGGTVDSISVLPWSGGFRAWVVVHRSDKPKGELSSFSVSEQTGEPLGSPEPVAWHAPESHYGNLLSEAIPLLDARAEAGGADNRHVRLFLTASGPDGRARILTAENFPVAGERDPAIFVRQLEPVFTPGRLPMRTYISDARSTADDMIVILGAFAVGLGLIGLGQMHGKRVIKRQRGWSESLVFFAAATAMTVFTLYERTHPNESGVGHQGYTLLFSGLFQPLSSSLFSLLAAYLVSAAYRAFCVRTRESALMAVAAALIMLGQVPIGNLLTRSFPEPLQIPAIMAWVMAVANNGVVRAINFGIFVGAIATALRVWLSMDPALNQSSRAGGGSGDA
jgi:hypothetical protein